MAIPFSDNFSIGVGNPIDAKYLNALNQPYANTGETNTRISESQRYVGLTVNIGNVEYWYKNGVSDTDLILKTFSGGTGGGTVTGGTNGLGISGKNICLGGILTNNTILDGGAFEYNLKYAGNYCGNYDNRSLVDKEYVDKKAPVLSGTTYHIPVYNASGNSIQESTLQFNGASNTLFNDNDLIIAVQPTKNIYLTAINGIENTITLGHTGLSTGVTLALICTAGQATDINLRINTKGNGQMTLVSPYISIGAVGSAQNRLVYCNSALILPRSGYVCGYGGFAGVGNTDATPIYIVGGNGDLGASGKGGHVFVCGGDAQGALSCIGGDVVLAGGLGTSGGARGNILMSGLPKKTTEINILYIDSTGKISSGATSGISTGGGASIYTITGNSLSTGFTITHNLGQRYIDVTVINNNPSSCYSTVYPSVTRPSVDTAYVSFNTAPTTGQQYTIVINGSGGTGGGSGTLTGAINGLHVTNKNVSLGGALTGVTTISDVRGIGIEYAADYGDTFTSRSLIDRAYSDRRGERNAKIIYQAVHGFSVGNVVGWDTSFKYTKAIANGLYDGEILGIVTKVYNVDNFELTQTGYFSGLTGLIQNKTYFLSDVTAGLLTTTEPIIVGHISKAMMIADTTISGWILPYAGYVVSAGGGGGGSNTKQITLSGHTFVVNDVIGWSGGTYNKAIANGAYNGEVIGIVSKVLSPNVFDLTQAGYVSGLTGLTMNATYFLSDVLAGKLTTTKTTTLGHVIRSVIVTDTPMSGWVLPYPGFVLTTGNTTSGITVGAGLGMTNVANTFNLNITNIPSIGTKIKVKIDTTTGTTAPLYIDSNDIIITGGTGGGTITGATNIGGGVGAYVSTLTKNLQFRTFIGSGSTSVSQSGNNIVIYSSGGTGSGTITGGTNGLGVSGKNIRLGGTLTGTTTIISNGIGNTAGIEYGADYSGGYTNRSLVDKSYVLSVAGGNVIPVYNVTGATYTATTLNHYIGASGNTTIWLPNSPITVGQKYIISDIGGNALTNWIYVCSNNPAGKKILNDWYATINTDYGSMSFVYNGKFWSAVAWVN